MLIHQPPSDKQIIDCLKASYGIQVSTIILLPLGADLNSCVYKADTQEKLSYFVKLRHGHSNQTNVAILDLLMSAKIPLIIPLIKTKSDHAFQLIDNFVLSVQLFIEGQNGFSQPLTDKQWQALGMSLKQVHEIEVPSSIQNQIRHENYSPKWRQIVQSLLDTMNEPPKGDEIAQKLFSFIKTHQTSIQRLVKRAEELAEKLKNISHPPRLVLCHSDIHAGNVLIDNQGNLFIVDWDDPIMAPKERDLMFIGGGVGNVWNEKSEGKKFYNGYGDVEIDMTTLAYYRHERIIEDIAQYAEQLLLTTTAGESRSIMYKHFTDMFEPKGVVDIAFETDEKSKTAKIISQ